MCPAFRGYIASDAEIEATKPSVLEEPEEWNDFWDYDDPGLEHFLAQDDNLACQEDDDCTVAGEVPDTADTRQSIPARVQTNALSEVRAIRQTIARTAQHYPFVCLDEDKADWRISLRLTMSESDVMMNANLGRVVLVQPGCRKVYIKCQLSWIEPFPWTLQQLRWSQRVFRGATRVQTRRRSCA